MIDFAVKVLTAPLGKTHLFSVGQAGYIIKSAGGQLLAVDLYLSDCVARLEGHEGYKRLLPKILTPDELDLDCLIATHPHLDHFDMDAVPALMANGKTRLYASVECAAEVERLRMTHDRATYVKPGDHGVCGDFELDFINCDHGTGAPDAVGVIIAVDGKRICMVGDTCLRLDRAAEYLGKGPLDVLIAPINGAYGNLNESECARLSACLAPKLTIPSHYGMFASHGGNPGLFFDLMNSEYPNNKYLLMTMGEMLTL